MINFEEYLLERKSSVINKEKRKVSKAQLKEMIANKDSSIADVDVSEIKDMSFLFKDSDFGGSWTADLSGWDTSKVENMRGMFWNCKELTKIELPHTQNVKDMIRMFVGCLKLVEAKIPHTQNVEYMEGIFEHCKSITNVGINDITKVKDTSDMFYGCEQLEQDFSSWDVEGKTKYGMFYGCTKMKGKNFYPKNY